MRNLSMMSLVCVFCLTACVNVHKINPSDSDMASKPTTAPVPNQSTSEKKPSSSVGYAGHGVESVTPEVLAHYAVPSLSGHVSRRIQAMMDLNAPRAGIITNDGNNLVFGWEITGSSQVWRLSKPMGFPEQLTGGEDATYLVTILPNDEHILVSRDYKGEENPGLYMQSIQGGPLWKIQHTKGVQTFFEWASPDSKYIYFRSNDRKKDAYAIYRYELETKKKELVFDKDGLWSIADVGQNGNLLLHKATGNIHSEYYELDLSKGELLPILGQNEKEQYRVRYGAKKNEYLVLTDKFGNYQRLYSYRNKKFTAITADIDHDVEYFTIDRNKNRILYSINRDGYMVLHALKASNFRLMQLPELPKADHVYIGNTSFNGRYTTIAVDDGKQPIRSFVIDWKQKKGVAWHRPATPEIDTKKFIRAKLEHYPARDGTKIPVWVRQSDRCDHKPCPVIVHFHGGPEGQARPGFNWRSQLYVDAGFTFVEPNVRGSTGYGKAWLNADNGPKRAEIITDIQDAAKWAQERFVVNQRKPKLGILGGSYGGYSVLVGMTIFAGTYDVGVQVVGISNLVTFLENTAPYRRILRASEYGDPVKDRQVLLELSPTTHMDKLNAPILHIQGATDPRVPVGEAIQIHQGLVHRGVDSTLMIFPDEGHGARKRKNRVLVYGHALRFFERHLLESAPNDRVD